MPGLAVWPSNLVYCALFNTLHAQWYIGKSSGVSRERFFIYAFTAAVVWCEYNEGSLCLAIDTYLLQTLYLAIYSQLCHSSLGYVGLNLVMVRSSSRFCTSLSRLKMIFLSTV